MRLNYLYPARIDKKFLKPTKKYVHSVWELASSVTAKIDEIKMAKVGSEQHADCTAEAKRIFDEMDNAVNWLETTDAEKVVKFIQPYRRV